MIVGVISDTHGYLDPRALEALRGVEAIIHAGDVGSIAILGQLGELAPWYAVQGNNDVPLGGLGLPERLDIKLDGCLIHVVHELPRAAPRPGASVVVFGHSHIPVVEERRGVLYLNPGAAGRRGFHRRQSVALLRIQSGVPSGELIDLGPREALVRNRQASA